MGHLVCGLSVPLKVLLMRAELTPELGELSFENEVQDFLGFWMRRTMINCPSVGFYAISVM